MAHDDATPAIFLLDASGACVAIDPAFTALTGLTIEKASGQGWLAALQEGERSDLQAPLAALLREQTPIARDVVLGAPGEERPIAFTLRPLGGAGGALAGFAGCLDARSREPRAGGRATDARLELERLAARLRQAEEVNSIVARVGKFAFWTLVPGQERPHWSPEMFALWGRDPALGTPTLAELLSRGDPADRERIMAATARLMSGHSDEIEYRITAWDGAVRWIHARREPLLDAGGKVQRMLGIAQDVTWRYDAQQERQRRDRLLGSIAYNLPDPAFVHDGKLILFVNRAAAALLGWDSQDQLAGLPLQAVVPGGEGERERARTERALAGGNSPSVEANFLRRDGTICPVEVTSLAAEFGGRPVVLETARDVTARRAAEEQRLVTDRAAVMATLAAGVAHEVNNPLAWLQSNVELIVDGLVELAGPTPTRRFAELIAMGREARVGSLRVKTIVRDLQTFASGEPSEALPQDPTEALELALRLVQQELSGRVAVTKRYQPVPLVRVDLVRLAQALMNIIANAAQAMAGREGKASELRLSVSRTADGGAQIEITDNGPGIAAGHLPRLFEPFFTTKPVGSGTGLGLSVALNAVRSMGGRIDVSSEPGQGATFRVVLPRAELTAPEGESIAPARERAARVLVVDDDPLIGQSLRRLLGRECEVVVTTSAAGALAALDPQRPFGLLLVDLVMPGMDGIQLFEKLNATAPDAGRRVIFMTGGAVSRRERDFLETAARTLIEKPFHAARVRALVRDALAAPGDLQAMQPKGERSI